MPTHASQRPQVQEPSSPTIYYLLLTICCTVELAVSQSPGVYQAGAAGQPYSCLFCFVSFVSREACLRRDLLWRSEDPPWEPENRQTCRAGLWLAPAPQGQAKSLRNCRGLVPPSYSVGPRGMERRPLPLLNRYKSLYRSYLHRKRRRLSGQIRLSLRATVGYANEPPVCIRRVSGEYPVWFACVLGPVQGSVKPNRLVCLL
jgi:hypothetical protein